MTSPVALMDLQGVSVARGGRTIWSEGTFAVPADQIVAVIGPNGSGKSTMLLMLLGLIPPASGTLRVLGELPSRGNPRIGYVPQNYAASSGEAIRARDLVLLGLTGQRWGLVRSRPEDWEKVDRALAAVGAEGYGDRRMSHLSGGQQQRVAIAQALVGEPQMLVLDEPLANLDVRNQNEIVALLGELNRRHEIGIVVVVHDLNPLLSVLDGAIYLLDGHAHFAGVNEVVSAELLTHLYGTRIQVVRTVQGDLFTRSG